MVFDWPFLPFVLRDKFWWFWIGYTILSYLFLVWSHRFAIRATGVREATYSQAIAVCLTEFVACQVLALLPLPVLWLLVLWMMVRVAAFKIFFKAEPGKALLGTFVSTAMSIFFSILFFFVFHLLRRWFF